MPHKATLYAAQLPIYYSTGTASAYLGWPYNRLHDRAKIGLVRPQLFKNTRLYTRRQLYIYKKSGYTKWVAAIDAELPLDFEDAVAFLAGLWGTTISDRTYSIYVTKYSLLRPQHIGGIGVQSRAAVRRFAIFYRRFIRP